MPPDQQNYNYNYYQYGVFWLYNWFQAENSNMNIFFLMNGNIYNYSLALNSWNEGSAYAIPPMPPGHIFCSAANICQLLFAQSYINAYNTAFNQSYNYQLALNKYNEFTYSNVSGNFIPGTFGYDEEYNSQGSNPGNSITIDYLQDDESVYSGTSYLFVSAGSGGGSGFMYLDWIIVTYGVPYVVNVS